jgi:short-subunit dehydrogenase
MTEEARRPRALVTGASSGFGEVFARKLAARGHDVVLVARRRDRLEQLASELSEKIGVGAEVIQADLSQDGEVSPVEERLRAGDIDLLVNNAGFATSGEFVQLPIERELEEIAVNVRAVVRLTHAALGPMIAHRRGGIINVASMAGFQPVPNMATYAATKAFVLHFSEAVHEEVKRHGVVVTALCPGPVKTEFQQVAGVDEARPPSFVWVSVDAVVSTALATLASRRAIAVPGTFSRLGVLSVRLMPRFVVRRVAGAMFKRGDSS